jgi:putative transcriptional regulator
MTISEEVARLVSALKRKNFLVEIFSGSNNCFDLIAKKNNITIIIKVYENIDSIRKGQGEELKKLAKLLNANCIIIGKKTKVFRLQNNTVYYRYDIPTMDLNTFESLLENRQPLVRYFKGKHIVDIDFEKLKFKRKQLEMEPEELAEQIGVKPESMYRFEKGASTSLETALKIEKILNEKLIKEIKVFEKETEPIIFDEHPDDKILEKMHELGMKMALFSHSPFRAYGGNLDEKGIFIGTGKGKFDIPKKAVELKKTSTIIDSDSIIITKEYKYKSVEGIPIIEEEDLDTINKLKELKKLIKEREETND